MNDFLILIIGIKVGVLLGWTISFFIRKKKKRVALVELQAIQNERDTAKLNYGVVNEKVQILEQQIKTHKAELEEKNNQLLAITSKLSTSEANMQNMLQKIEEQKKELESVRQQMNIEFRNLANDILEEKTKKFTEQNREKLDELLKPLGEKLKDFEKKVEETYNKESRENFSLKEELKRLSDLNLQISKDATNLTNALKGQVKTQGNWGEVILKTILERSGLVENREFFAQESVTTEDGKRFQPDIVVTLPDNKNVIIDSKVTLVAYERYASANTIEEQDVAMKEHIIAIKNHIIGLSQKNYQDLYKQNQLDFVMMFLPIEPAYMLAIQKEPEIWNFAYDKRILLIGPTNLIAALKLIQSLWKQEYQSRNVLEIAKRGGDLYDKLVGFIEDLLGIKKKLDDAQRSLESSINKLHEGKGNILKRAEEMKSLGAKAKKSLPVDLLDLADEFKTEE
ncbi:MAG: DNA recombination protein RmuC [Bacteroidia bacterium]|nr:DNA recombination protein RmuC [Bacteroidia bacterium]